MDNAFGRIWRTGADTVRTGTKRVGLDKVVKASQALVDPSKERLKAKEEGEPDSALVDRVDRAVDLGDAVVGTVEEVTKIAGGLTFVGVNSAENLTKAALGTIGIEGDTAKKAANWVGGLQILKVPAAAAAAGVGVASLAVIEVLGVEDTPKGEDGTVLSNYATWVRADYKKGGDSASSVITTVRDTVRDAQWVGKKVKEAERVVSEVQAKIEEAKAKNAPKA